MAARERRIDAGRQASGGDDLTCQEFVRLIGEFLDNELSDSRHDEKFERHRRGCKPCAEYLDGYLKTVAAVRELKQVDERAEMPEDIVQSILASRPKPTRRS